MIAVTTTWRILGYQIVAYIGIVQGAAFDDLLKNADALGANAVLNTCYDNALHVDTLFHGSAVIIEPISQSFASPASRRFRRRWTAKRRTEDPLAEEISQPSRGRPKQARENSGGSPIEGSVFRSQQMTRS